MKKVILILFILYLFTITAFAGDTDMYLMANDDAKLFTARIETVNENMVHLKVVRKIKGNITENELLKIPYFEYNSRKDKVLEPDDSCFIAMVGQKFFFSIETTSTDPKTLKFINHLTNKSMNMEGQSIDERIEKLINDGSYEEAEKKRLSKTSTDMTTSDENVKKTKNSKRNPQPMQLIILFTSLIPVLLLTLIGFLIKFKKTYWLISGYNMMSQEKKKNVDIENLGKFTANVCFIIAAILLAAGIAISLNLAAVSGIIISLLVPINIYTLIHAQKYDGNTRNSQGNMKTGTKLLIGSIIGFLLLITAGVMVLLYFSNLPSRYIINNGIFEISGMYGQKVNIKDISNLELKDTLPEVLYKSNGSAINNKLKGNFKLKDIGQAKLFVDSGKPPFVFLTANSKIFIFNCEERTKTKELFESLKNERQKSVTSSDMDSSGADKPKLETTKSKDQTIKPSQKEIAKRVEQNLEVIQSTPATSSNPGDYIKAHQNEYQTILKMGDDALNYMLSCFKAKNTEGLKGHIMMSLCQELLGDRNNVHFGEYNSPQEWYEKLSPYTAQKLPKFKYSGNNPIEELVYTAALSHYDRSMDETTLTVVAPHIFGTYEQNNEMKIFSTIYYSSYRLYGNTLSDGSAGVVPAAMIFSKNSDGTYTLKEYKEAMDGAYFKKSIEDFCKPRNDIAKEIMKHYGNYKDLFDTMRSNLKNYFQANGFSGINLKQADGTVIPIV